MDVFLGPFFAWRSCREMTIIPNIPIYAGHSSWGSVWKIQTVDIQRIQNGIEIFAIYYEVETPFSSYAIGTHGHDFLKLE